jgi:hypothetical protein
MEEPYTEGVATHGGPEQPRKPKQRLERDTPRLPLRATPHRRHNGSAITGLGALPAGLRSPGCHRRHNGSAITRLGQLPGRIAESWVPRAAQAAPRSHAHAARRARPPPPDVARENEEEHRDQ